MKKRFLTQATLISILTICPNLYAEEDRYAGQLGISLLSTERATGYSVNISWTPSDHFLFRAGVNSSRSDDRFNVVQLEQLKTGSVLTEDVKDELFDEFGDKEYTPRDNEMFYGFRLMRPFTVTDSTVMLPYIEAGQVRSSTKSIVVVKSSSTTGPTGTPNNKNTKEYSFPSINAFYVGAGLQLRVNATHFISLGVINYANGNNWRNFDVSTDYRGATLEYQARYHRLSFTISAESVDMFGDPRLKTGLAINF